MPLYAEFRSNLDHVYMPYKLHGISVSADDIKAQSEFKDLVKSIIRESEGGNETTSGRRNYTGSHMFFKKQIVFQVEQSIAFVDLNLLEDVVTEIDLVCQAKCNIGPFSTGKSLIGMES